MKQLIFLITAATFVLAAVTSPAQQFTPKDRAYRQLSNNMRVPPGIEDCTVMVGVAVVPVVQNKVSDGFLFSTGFLPLMQEEVKRCFKRINIALITRDYFRLSPQARYNILFPIVVRADVKGCQLAPLGDSLSSLTRKFRTTVKGKVYKMDEFEITLFSRTSCGFSPERSLASIKANAEATNPTRLSAKPSFIATRPFLP